MNNIIERIWKQSGLVNIEDLRGTAFQAEESAHTFRIRGVDESGEPLALTGTVGAVFLRADNTDVAITGTITDGAAEITLTDECYDMPGRFGLTIYVTSDEQTVAVYAAIGSVCRTSSGVVSQETGEDVTDLINAIAEAVATIPASYTDLMAAVAPTYSTSALYAIGSYAWYDGKLYRCTTAITSGETWTSAHWTLANLGSDVSDLKSAVDDIFTEEIINTYPESNKSNFTTLTNNNIYILENYVPKYGTVKGIKLYAKSSGTLSLYFCTLDFVNHIAKLVKKIDVTCVSGDNDITFSEAFFAQEKTYIGMQGNGILSYRNTSTGDYGTVNNPHYESSSAITTAGVTFTENSSAYFRYPVEIKAISSSFASIQNLENYATKDELALAIPSGTLNRGNMLRYHQAESGEYTLWGRWFDMSVNGTSRKCTNNAGSEIMFSITGASSVVFTFDQATPNSVNPFMAFSVDGGEFTRQQLSTDNSLYKTTLTLSDNGDHIIRMSVDAISQTDSAYKWNGTNALALVSIVPNAGVMKAIVPMNKMGLFYGDSVTEGINVLSSGNTNTDQSATQAYSYWTARYLNSIRYCVGYGGSGMTQTGSFKPCIDAVNYMKNGIPTGILYPDYIVINHGVNDYSGSASDFKAAYLIVINRLRIKYPGVPIFMVYPFMTTATNTKFVEGMEDIADDYTNVYFIPTLGWNGETTDGTHLSVDGAKADADKLANEIVKVLGKGFFIS